MRLLLAAGALFLLAFVSQAKAQVQLGVQTTRSQFLLYERVDVIISVTNATDTNLVLDNDGNHPWLSFLVTKSNHMPVRNERAGSFKPISLKPNETKTLRVNITPLYAFRETGNYNVAAVVNVSGTGDIISEPVPFTVVNGLEVWKQSRPINGVQRTYSLIRFSPSSDKTNLYLRVAEPSDNLVLTNYSIGEIVAYIDPDVYFDPQNNLHLIMPIASGTYLYSRIDPDGKIVHGSIFRSFQHVAPRLSKLEDGNIVVVGGMEEKPNGNRESLSESQHRTAKVDPSGTGSLPTDAPVADLPANPRPTLSHSQGDSSGTASLPAEAPVSDVSANERQSLSKSQHPMESPAPDNSVTGSSPGATAAGSR